MNDLRVVVRMGYKASGFGLQASGFRLRASGFSRQAERKGSELEISLAAENAPTLSRPTAGRDKDGATS